MKRFSIFILTTALVLIGTAIFAFMHHEDNLNKKIKFTLIDKENVEITEKDFHGKWLLLYLGFTNCPKVCPMQMSVMKKILQELDVSGHSVLMTPVFITVDPERDTSEVMKNYTAYFDARIVGLTGSQQEIKKVKQNFRAFSKTGQMPGDSKYDVVHSDFFYLVDPNGHLVQSYENSQDFMQLSKNIRDKLNNNIKTE
jgi:protein SCO1/2